MRKLFIVFVFLVSVLTTTHGQQTILFSQYMNNLVINNPAAVGHNDMINIGGSFRSLLLYIMLEQTSASILVKPNTVLALISMTIPLVYFVFKM